MDYLRAFTAIRNIMVANRSHLIALDQRMGDGDLGISMVDGFSALVRYLENVETMSDAQLFRQLSKHFNEAAPSSLGTILSFGLMGMAKSFKKHEIEKTTFSQLAEAMQAGVLLIMEKTGSDLGEKTILDSIYPAVQALIAHLEEGRSSAFMYAYEAAKAGVEHTRTLKAVHGRAAYYGEKSLGLEDAGAVAGMLIFEALATMN